MFTNTKCSIYAGQDKVYTESVCLSTDVKPTTGIANGSVCLEMNTGKKFMFNEDGGEWVEVPSSGGGGGGDFSTAQVTVTSNVTQTIFSAVHVSDDYLVSDYEAEEGYTDTLTGVLYKGEAHWSILNGTVAVTGNATTETPPFGGTHVIITGDCTITIS